MTQKPACREAEHPDFIFKTEAPSILTVDLKLHENQNKELQNLKPCSATERDP